jgi:hypothetical protein
VIAILIGLAAASAPASPTAAPTSGPATAQIRSETFKRPFNDKPQVFRVDYTASLTWTLKDGKACLFVRCGAVCDMVISHKVLSRQLWWTPPGRPPVLAENDPSEREYAGGVTSLPGPCNALTARDIARGAANSLRPYQFTDELIKDRPDIVKAADNYLVLYPPKP